MSLCSFCKEYIMDRPKKVFLMRAHFTLKIIAFVFALLLLAYLPAPALAVSDEDLRTLGMFYDAEDLEVTATRNPKPLSRTAENITVITNAEIEMMGAHTLADILNNVPGVNIDDRGSVGTFSGITIQGALFTHILVMLDGVMLNFFSDSSSDISAIPVQHIERIEIVKGPASSSWGPALGGVVNIVTKSPREDKKVGGALSASIGEKMTRDARGEVSGTLDRLGYYFYAGHLASDGLNPHTGVESDNLYAKLRWELPERGALLFTLGYTNDYRGDGIYIPANDAINTRHRYFLSTLSLNYPLTDRLDLDLSLRGLLNRNDSLNSAIDPALDTSNLGPNNRLGESTYGGSAKLTWRQGIQSLAAGLDFDHVNSDVQSNQAIFPDGSSRMDLHSDKWGIFLNDMLAFKSFTISPGIRYDRMRPVGDFFSPSLGLAWNLTDKITLRAYGARGYSLPLIVPGSTQEKVWTVQTGIETTLIPCLWFKTTYFLNYLSDVGGSEKDKKQGVEVEMKTVPLFNTSISAGYTFIDIKNRDTGETIKDQPRHLVKMGIYYDDQRSFRGSLLGRYVDWNSSPDSNARYSAVIWDLNLAKKVFNLNDTAIELFFNAHNLFNGAQYNWDVFKNVRKWVEGGIRFNF